METYQVGLSALAIFTLFGIFAYGSWVSRRRKQESLISAPQLVEDLGLGETAQYVATVFAGRPLERVVAHGLAHRGKATVLVSSDGVSIFRTGEKSFLIPSVDIKGISQASAVIDRAVEKDGITVILWYLGGTELETHVRFVGASARTTTLSQLKDLVA
jgi:hypothetical protein